MLTLSPSDLTYLYDDCKRCFWLKAQGLKPSRDKLPAVFSDIDSGMKGGVTVAHLQEMGIPAVEFLPGDWVESEPFECGGCDMRILGKTDRVCRLEDGTFAIVDYKTTGGDDRKINRFWKQLSAYRRALEFPAKGEPKEVAALAIVAFTPSRFTVDKDGERCAHTGRLQLHYINTERETFLMFLADVGKLASSEEMPASGSWCGTCRHVKAVMDRLAKSDGLFG